MELWLSSSGYRTITAHSAAEAEKISAEVTPKVVITDIGLPDSSGYDLRLRLQTISGMENAHFIALSGQSVNEAPQLAVESGFHSYITKPPDFEELADVLRECFRAQD
jgi:DNA-binding response OmpR family regulator